MPDQTRSITPTTNGQRRGELARRETRWDPFALFDDFQQKWITDWRPMIVCYANAVKTMVQGNVGGYEKSAGPWFGYRSNQEIRLRYLVDNGSTAYKG